ncbi:hypothetical protein RSO01_56380 [Reyranella soli]|uniref:Uncharacterized protein n=1 Tax=Reyranella soli TaxID=1230389 RepID=A0A512NHS3_9HYPH|nr:hypothetical protein RSO01_56380 [Reyranella soli]
MKGHSPTTPIDCYFGFVRWRGIGFRFHRLLIGQSSSFRCHDNALSAVPDNPCQLETKPKLRRHLYGLTGHQLAEKVEFETAKGGRHARQTLGLRPRSAVCHPDLGKAAG